MKTKIYIFLGVLSILSACSSPATYNITGTINKEAGTIYLQKVVEGAQEVIDSSLIANGTFSFTGSVSAPDIVTLSLAGSRDRKNICLENTNYVIQGNDKLSAAVVQGGLLQKQMISFTDDMSQWEDKERGVMKQLRKTWKDSTVTEAERNKLKDQLASIRENKLLHAKNFIKSKPSHPHGVTVLSIYVQNFLSLDQLDSVYQTFSPDVKASGRGSEMGLTIKSRYRSAVGQPFIDFTIPAQNGDKVVLKDVVKKNKLVMIDFWASWCAPCRATMPYLKERYDKYKPDGFEVLAVSYDSKRDAWEQAIERENLTWINASYLDGWKCPTKLLYAVRGVPSNVLITNDGTIVGKNLHGDKLDEMIEKHLR